MTSPPRVSMEITDEMLKSMEVGLAFRDYVSSLSYLSPQFICLSIVGQTLRCCLIMGESGVGTRNLLAAVVKKSTRLLKVSFEHVTFLMATNSFIR